MGTDKAAAVSFFSRGVNPPESDEKREPYQRQSSWHGPSNDEVCQPVPVSFVLARSDAAAVVVQGIKVYTDGCLFDIAWTLRRTDEDTQRWVEVGDIAYGHRHTRQGGADALQFGLEFSDGTAVRTSDRWDWRNPGDGPHIAQIGGSGSSGGTERVHGSMQLWLHPLPPRPTVDLVCAWPRFGLDEARHTIDTAVLRDAASQARFIWPEDADLPLATDD